jgi:hypothetical protein
MSSKNRWSTVLKTLGLCILLGSCALGCSKRVSFTHDMRDLYKLEPDSLKGVQFFNSEAIILRRVRSAEVLGVADHKLQRSSAKDIDEVRIAANTPGTVQEVGDYYLKISFEPGNTLTFGTDKKNPQIRGGRYVLFADSWDQGAGELKYDGITYWAVEGSRFANLYIEMNDLKRKRETKRQVKGMRVTK